MADPQATAPLGRDGVWGVRDRDIGAMTRPLDAARDLDAAARLLAAALPWDAVGPVVAEKLFGGNGRRTGQVVGAFFGDELIGLLAQAGRWVKLLAVSPQVRRRGVGTLLLDVARAAVRATVTTAEPAPRLRIGDHPGNYLSPGVDERERSGQAFLAARGFVEVGRNLNLRAPMRNNGAIAADHIAARIAAAQARGYTIRRATAADEPALSAMVTAAFHAVWAFEVRRALGSLDGGGDAALHTPTLPEGAAVHLAIDERGEIAAFAAHDGNNRGLGWFGPTGTLPAHRGKGLGEALLLCCLRDVADAEKSGRPDAGVIAWVGPVEYYARTCGAAADRRFIVYEEAG